MPNEYTEHLKLRLSTDDFEFVPAREPSHKMAFATDNRVSGGKFTSWQMLWDKRRGQMQIRLLKGAQMDTWLWLRENGVWAGKDRTNASVELRVHEDQQHLWSDLHSPKAFHKEPEQREIPKSFLAYVDTPTPEFPWSDYDIELEKPEGVPDNKTAIIFICANRLKYAEEVFSALANNTGVGEYPVYCFIDMPEKEYDKGIQAKHEKMILSHMPSAVIIKRPVNFGCGRNIIDAKHQIFDVLGYERAFVFEDDCVPAKSVLRLTENMMDWAESQWDNIGVVQSWVREFFPMEKKDRTGVKLLNDDGWWMYLQTRKSWDLIKEYVYTYRELFLKQEKYRDRPFRTIKDWVDIQTKKPRDVQEGTSYPLTTSERGKLATAIEAAFGGGQDHILQTGLYITGQERLGTISTRGKYIGVRGIHSHKGAYDRKRFSEVVPLENGNDARLKNFVIHKETVTFS